MSNAAALFPDGAHVVLVAVSAVEATPRALPLVDRPALAASDLQLALVALEAVAEALAHVVASPNAVEVAAASAVALAVTEEEVTEEASVEGLVVEAEEEVALVVVEEVSATNRTASDLPMVLPPVPAVHEEVASAAIVEVAMEATVVVEAVTKTDAAAVAAATIADPAERTTSPSVAETDLTGLVTGLVTVGTVEAAGTTARESVHTMATATTTEALDGDTRPYSLDCGVVRKGLSKGYLPFSSVDPFSSMRVRRSTVQLLTSDYTAIQYRRVRRVSRLTSDAPSTLDLPDIRYSSTSSQQQQGTASSVQHLRYSIFGTASSVQHLRYSIFGTLFSKQAAKNTTTMVRVASDG
jgi:hypothetical protein